MVNNGFISINGQEIPVYNDSEILSRLENTASKTHTHPELHTHSNKVQLDKVGENPQGKLTYNGSVVSGSGSTNLGGLSDVDMVTKAPVEGDVLIYQGGKWKPGTVSLQGPSSVNVYMLELTRWGIKNNGTDAINTSRGINNALIWASNQYYTEIIFPKGTYLIALNNEIRPQSFTTLNLNGSTFKMESNKSNGYMLIAIEEGKKNIRITNGVLEGDRNTHDYSDGDTHEHGFGILIRYSCTNIMIDNLEIHSMTGDAVSVQCGTGYVGEPGSIPQHWSFLDGSFVTGGINKDGTLNVDLNFVRSKNKIDVTVPSMINNGRAFVIAGNDYGTIGSSVTGTIVDVAFYASNNKFIQLKKTTFFEEIPIPEEASYAYMSIRQSIVPDYTGITIRYQNFPRNVYIDKCDLHHNRRLGIMLSGQEVHLTNSKIHDNGTTVNGVNGTGPYSGLDIEDGGGLNQHIFIENNNFYNNKDWNLILVYGKNIRLKNNTFRDKDIVIMVGSSKNQIIGNVFINSGANLYGETLFSDNILFNSHLDCGKPEWESTVPLRMEVSSCYFHNSSLGFSNNQPYSCLVSDCAFFADESFEGDLLGIGELPQTIRDCTIYGGSLGATTFVQDGWIIEGLTLTNCKGVRLANATYKQCRFINPGKIDVVNDTNAQIVLDQCHFEWSAENLFEPDMIVKLIRVKNSTFKGKDKPAFFIWQTEKIELINNNFEFNNTVNTSVIALFYADTKYVVIKGNQFISSSSMDIIALSNVATNVEFADNSVDTMSISQNALINPNNNKINGNMGQATEPTSGYYKRGQLIPNSNPVSGGYMGWITTTEGIANTLGAWKKSTYIYKGTTIFMNGYFYVSLTNEGSTGATAPKWPTTLGSTVVDNKITWKNIGVKAVFKSYGQIS